MSLAVATTLRRIAAALADGEALAVGDAAWLGERLAAYLAGAAGGLTIEQSFGLALAPGETPWWEADRLARRDTVVRALAARFDGPPARRAELAADRLARYAVGAWRTDQRSTEMPRGYRGTIRGEMFAVMTLSGGDPPSARSIRRFLAQSEGFSGHELGLLVASGLD